jgi:hypothetical protein
MQDVDLVIWLPRSRRAGRGEYQCRVWCSVEAGLVRLRSLPVIIAGHSLDTMQLAQAAWGSYLIVPPWWRPSDHPGCAEVVLLGQVNFAVYVLMWILLTHYFLLAPVLRSPMTRLDVT